MSVCANCCNDKPSDGFKCCEACRAEWRSARPRKTVDRKHFDVLLNALNAIAIGAGVYGAQAGEYKQIAREAISKVRGV